MVVWDHAAPEGDVSPALPAGGAAFCFEIGYGRRGRDGVEGHVDDGGDAAGRSGACSRPEALPVRSAGLVEMDVGTADEDRGEH